MASAWGQSWGLSWGNSWGSQVQPIVVVTGGGYAPDRRKRKQREFDEEIKDRKALREFIERALTPLETESAEVVAVEDSVAVLPKTGDAIAIPVPPAFNAAYVSRLIMQILQSAKIEAERVRNEQAMAKARQVYAEWLIKQRKRQREEEWLLLMN